MKKYIIQACGLIFIASAMLYGQEGVTKVGTTAGGFLTIDAGPKATAMGGAFVSIADDITAMYWNPSGIAGISTMQAGFISARWIADLTYNYAGIVIPAGDVGTFGLNASFLTMDEIEITTINEPDGTGAYTDAGMYAFGISYARFLTDNFSIGFNGKYINERVHNSSAEGFALDLGVLYNTNISGLTLGMSITNFGTKMQLEGRDLLNQVDIAPNNDGNNGTIRANLETNEYDLPLMFRVGLSMDVLENMENNRLIVAVDALHPSDDNEYINIGAEYVFNDLVFLRAGFKEVFLKDSQQGLNLGGGINYTINGTSIGIDYAFLDFGVLDAVHMYSIKLGL